MSAVAGPRGPDISKAPLLVGVTAMLHVISLSLYGARICARIWTRITPSIRLGLDDYFITAAVMFDMMEWVLLLVSITYGVGRHNYYISAANMVLAEKFLFLSQPPYAWSLAFSKMSIAWMLMRIQRDRKLWAACMYFIMFFVVGIAITMNAFQFSMCRPLWAIWDHSNPDAASIYATAAMTIVTDITLSLAPISFIVNIQRPMREKVALGFVMGLGILASSASIAKTSMVKDYGITGDDLMDGVNITIWSILEMQLAIIASCIPALKQLFEKILRRVGLMSTHSPASRSGYLKQDDEGTLHHNHHLATMRSRRDVKTSANADTDSVESEMPIMNPGLAVDPNVYFKTSIKADGPNNSSSQEQIFGGSSHNSAGARGIQKHTTVSVLTSSKTSVDAVV
ncbi:hypothetical protein QBC46DRAFT_432099 [Diplogelasinospora grovesii]|uniref:Rhodopsin domain-containing protein n=1 Tax=Diplogelasinospora grovesii TaxID=303347 RepID=A0AAN6RXM6_9PEZI|nr:hypothetical protein QBC46DRAFT_432099 [Diplogelasinospora grovesii]